jgi:hypothetical protein
MPAELNILNGYAALSDPNLSSRIQTIVDCMEGNVHYPAPLPSLAVVEAALVAFRSLINLAGTAEKAARDEKRQELIFLVHALGRYVLFTANNNEAVLHRPDFLSADRRSPNNRSAKPLIAG